MVGEIQAGACDEKPAFENAYPLAKHGGMQFKSGVEIRITFPERERAALALRALLDDRFASHGQLVPVEHMEPNCDEVVSSSQTLVVAFTSQELSEKAAYHLMERHPHDTPLLTLQGVVVCDSLFDVLEALDPTSRRA